MRAGYLPVASQHASGLDRANERRRREDAGSARALSLTLGDPQGVRILQRGDAVDYAAAYESYRAANKLVERKGAPLGLHLLIGVSAEALEGDPHDPHNPAVRRLFNEAKNWCDDAFGTKCCWALRYDVDEAGAAIVDVLLTPKRKYQYKSGETRWRAATRRARDELVERTGDRNDYAAMQTAWAAWAKEHVHPAIERGVPKKRTGREHLPPDVYAEAANENEAAAFKVLAQQQLHRGMDKEARAAIRSARAFCRRAGIEYRERGPRRVRSAREARTQGRGVV